MTKGLSISSRAAGDMPFHAIATCWPAAALRDLGVGLQRDTCLYNRTIGRARSESSLQPGR